ncbi:unnamed protein product [Meloidogyne enterolobii]|uniref:Uncharacterized protein n=1 Tax=Meloidogyne enterolobii TaxID=390850 RepID=A0ACB0YFC6_MELEN
MDTISVTSSLESLSEIPQISSISSSKKVGPPKRKGVGGRQKKDIHSHIETVEPTVTGPRNIDFSTLNTLEFATAKTYEPSICSRTVMPLYERDSEKLGPRFIETMWNNLSTWLNDAFIFPYLCYLAKISGRKTIVVDPLITDPTVQQVPDLTYINYTYITEQEREVEVLILPVHLPGHWTLLIWDSEFGVYFFDSIPNIPHRLHEDHVNYHPQRLPKLKEIISELTNTPVDLLHIGTYATDLYPRQQDGNSCGYFICLYAEAWLMNNRNMALPHLNINTEKKRILWHLNQLYSGDNVEYHPRSVQEICRPKKIKDKAPSRQSTPRASKNTVADPKGDQVLPLTQRCYLKHQGIRCGSIESGHLPEYYNSGSLGDRTCVHCNNKLLKSEKCLACADGRVRLDPLKEYPNDYERLLTVYLLLVHFL